jgi:hypothetical protein
MDLSSLRTALNVFSGASPVLPASKAHGAQAGAFLLGAETRLGAVMDLNNPAQLHPEIMEDFTQDDVLAIDYTPGKPVPVMSLFYNANFAATEVRLDSITVALVRMRAGHGPLRSTAIILTADPTLRA